MCTGELHVHKPCVLANMRARAQAQSDFSASTQIWSRPCVCSFCKRCISSSRKLQRKNVLLILITCLCTGLTAGVDGWNAFGWSLAAVWECIQALRGALLGKLSSSAGGDPWQGEGDRWPEVRAALCGVMVAYETWRSSKSSWNYPRFLPFCR